MGTIIKGPRRVQQMEYLIEKLEHEYEKAQDSLCYLIGIVAKSRKIGIAEEVCFALARTITNVKQCYHGTVKGDDMLDRLIDKLNGEYGKHHKVLIFWANTNNMDRCDYARTNMMAYKKAIKLAEDARDAQKQLGEHK